MKKPKKIILYNSTKMFREGFAKGCNDYNVDLTKIRTRFCSIHLKNNAPAKFVHKNEEFDVRNSINFFQLRGKEAHISALIALYCSHNNIPFNDPINTHHSNNVLKISQMMMLWLNKLPIPETVILSSFSYKKNRDYIKKEVSFPLVLKKNKDRGQDVWKINSILELDKKILLTKQEENRAIKEEKIETMILQEFIPNTHDFRVTLFDGDILGAIKRSSVDGFHNNWSRGAKCEASDISEKEATLSRKACDACDIDLGGVDFVRTDAGILFFEVNKSPQINKNYPKIIAKKILQKN